MIFLFTTMLLGCSDPNVEVFENYKINKKNIYQAREYFSTIMPKDLALYIRFESDTVVNFSLYQSNYANKASWNKSGLFDKYGQFRKFNVDLNSMELRAALELVKFTPAKLKKLRQYLKQAKCVSIGNSNAFLSYERSAYISLGFPTDDLYGLEYYIFQHPRTDKEMRAFNEDCSVKTINSEVLVKYGGPAFGSDCFPDKR
jgi:hypothetical protein